MTVKVTGFDKLQCDLESAQRALRSLDGTIATAEIDPHNPASVSAAVKQMEDAIDAKVRPYRGTAFVDNLAKALKEKYRTAILKRAAERRAGFGQ